MRKQEKLALLALLTGVSTWYREDGFHRKRLVQKLARRMLGAALEMGQGVEPAVQQVFGVVVLRDAGRIQLSREGFSTASSRPVLRSGNRSA